MQYTEYTVATYLSPLYQTYNIITGDSHSKPCPSPTMQTYDQNDFYIFAQYTLSNVAKN